MVGYRLMGGDVLVRARAKAPLYPVYPARLWIGRSILVGRKIPAAPRSLSRSRAALLCGTAAVASLIGATGHTFAQGVTTQFTVGGQVTAQHTFTLADLQALSPVVTENVSFLAGANTTNATFTGVSMFNLLNNVVGIRTTP